MDKRELDFVDEYYTNVDLALLKKLTLIVPTYDRNYYLSRCLWYHAHFPFGQIIVADSSPENKKVVNRETVKKIQEIFGANVLYLKYEPEIDLFGGDIYDKWADAVLHADKEYTLICADREFLFPETLINCISYLSIHQDFGFICGQKYYIKDSGTNDRKRYMLQPRNARKSNEISNDPCERYIHSINNPPLQNSLLLNIGKTSILQKMYSAYLASNINDIRYGEYFIGFLGHLHAKSEYCSHYSFKIRDNIDFDKHVGNYTFQKKSSESSYSRYPYFHQYSTMVEGEQFKQEFITSIEEEFEKLGFTIDTDFIRKNIVSEEHLISHDVGKPDNKTKKGYIIVYNHLVKLKAIRMMWNNLPKFLKDTIQNIGWVVLHVQIPNKFIPLDLKIPDTPDFKIIVNIIDKTYKNHVTDTAISFYPKEW